MATMITRTAKRPIREAPTPTQVLVGTRALMETPVQVLAQTLDLALDRDLDRDRDRDLAPVPMVETTATLETILRLVVVTHRMAVHRKEPPRVTQVLPLRL